LICDTLKPYLFRRETFKNGLQFFTGIIPDIRFSTVGLNKIITLLPDADRMGLDARKILEVLNCELIHAKAFKLLQ
jgi:hypothetical protein